MRFLVNFKKLNISSYIYNIFQIFTSKNFKGWGKRRTGRFASWCHANFGGTLILQEDGFIRSLGLGVNGYPSFSLIEDNVGIYYDASSPSKLENLLNNYDFQSDTKLMSDARRAIDLLIKYHVSKYNHAPDIDENYFLDDSQKVLIIAQTAQDASLKYGMMDEFSTDYIIDTAIKENPDKNIYLKIHPDVLIGKKKSDIDIESARKKCIIIDDDVNPISLLKHFSKVYTKTSGMGFEALLVGCECVCFGMPFYAGWGVTLDKSKCSRRKTKRSVEEIFAAAYILYTRYHNPYTNKPSNILETIKAIKYYKYIHNKNIF